MKKAKVGSHHHKIKEMTHPIKENINNLIRINISLIIIIIMTIIQEELEIINTTIKEIIINKKRKTTNNFRNIIPKNMNTMIKKEIIVTMITIIKAASQSKRVIRIISLTHHFHTSQNLKMIIEIKTYISLKDGKDQMCCLQKLKGNFWNSLKYFKKIRISGNFKGCRLIFQISIIISKST